MRGRPWSSEQISDLFRMRDVEGKKFSQIDKLMDRPKNSACMKYHSVREARSEPAVGLISATKTAPTERFVPSREQFRHRSLTAFVCGDPLPGRSALDAKRAERAANESFKPPPAGSRSHMEGMTHE